MTRADFSDLVRKLSRKLYVYAFRILKSKEGAKDAVQEIFLRLWKMNTHLEEFESIEAMVTTMTKNYCIDQLRKLKSIESKCIGNFTLYQAGDPDPLEQLENSETRSIMDKIIGTLPENYRELIQLRDIAGLSYKEISQKTALKINTLRVTLSRARKIVRIEFLKYSYEQRGNKESAGEVL